MRIMITFYLNMNVSNLVRISIHNKEPQMQILDEHRFIGNSDALAANIFFRKALSKRRQAISRRGRGYVNSLNAALVPAHRTKLKGGGLKCQMPTRGEGGRGRQTESSRQASGAPKAKAC